MLALVVKKAVYMNSMASTPIPLYGKPKLIISKGKGILKLKQGSA
jgi:hypothetical protein